MSYSLRNIIIGYIAVLAVVLLILFIIYSTLISQEKEQVHISEARAALQKLQPAITNAQELELITSNYSRSPDNELSDEYAAVVAKIRIDSVTLSSLSEIVTENKSDYLQLARMTRVITDTCDRIMQLADSKVQSRAVIHSIIIKQFKDLASKLEGDNRKILNNAYSNSIGYTRKTFTFVRVTLIAMMILLLLSVIFIYNDIRNRRKTEMQLVKFNTELEKQVADKTAQIIREKDLSDSIINSLPGIFYLQDMTGKNLRWNKELERISGYSSEEVSKMNALDFFDEESKPLILDAQKKILQTGIAHTETSAVVKGGKKIPFLFMGQLVKYEDRDCIIGTGIDITARKKIEQENERIRYLLNERVKELSTLYRCSQLLQTENKSLTVLLQEVVEVIPGGWQYPEITAASIKIGEASYNTNNYRKGVHQQDAPFTTPDGQAGLVEVIYLEKRPPAGEDAFSAEERDLINMLADLISVSLARRHASEELKKSEANLHTIFDTTDTIYILLDNNFRVISYNQRAVQFSAQQLKKDIKEIQSNFMQHFSPDREPVLSDWLKKAATGDHVTYEQSFAQPDGSMNWYSIRMFPITGSGKTIFGLMLAVSDITAVKIAEQEMVDREVQDQKKITRAVLQAQEMERNKIGQELHDNVNQILASTKLYLGMAMADYKDEHEYIKQSIQFVEEAIAEIRNLSSKEVSPIKEIDIRELIQSLIDQINRRSEITTHFSYRVNNEKIEDDLKLNIYRIVQEEVNNMLKHSAARKFSIVVEEKENDLHVHIEDNGVGFNPSEKRNGIGISNIINRVKSYNGDINIDSQPGKGCKTDIRIPFK